MRSPFRKRAERKATKRNRNAQVRAVASRDPVRWKVILAGLDGSPRAPGVFNVAVEVARRFGADLHVVRVISVPPDFPAAAHTVARDLLPAFLEKEARKGLASLLPAGFDDARVRVIAEDQPWRGILACADDIDADIVVIGSHGYAGFDRVLGTTAGKVANHACRHVLVVHDPT